MQFLPGDNYNNLNNYGRPSVAYPIGTTYTNIVERIITRGWIMQCIRATNRHGIDDNKFTAIAENNNGVCLI